MNSAGPGGALSLALSRWAAADRKPLVLLIDEIDALVGDTLLSVLRQLRSGGGPPDRVRPRAGTNLGGEEAGPHSVARRREYALAC